MNAASIVDQRYRILGVLGEGAASRVYRVRDIHHPERVIALKLLAGPHAHMLARREFLLLASLAHPALPRVHDFGRTAEGAAFFTQDLFEGDRLSIAARGNLTPKWLRNIALKLADVLAYLHERGVLHRDIKPANVIVTSKGPRLVDLGLAVARPGHRMRRAIGTPGYLAPELLLGDPPSAASDLYSLGATLYAASEQRTPFGRLRSADDICKLTCKPSFQSLEHTDSELATILLQLLAREPERRGTAGALRLSLAHEAPVALPGASLIGRASMIKTLVAASAGAVLIEAPSGTGKTRLLRVLRQMLEVSGKRVRIFNGRRKAIAHRLRSKAPAEITLVDDAHRLDATGVAALNRARSGLVLTAAPHTQRRPLDRALDALKPQRITLTPLDEPDVEAMLRSVLGCRAPDALISAMHRESGGNPRHIERALGKMHACGGLTLTKTGWTPVNQC